MSYSKFYRKYVYLTVKIILQIVLLMDLLIYNLKFLITWKWINYSKGLILRGDLDTF